MIPDERIPQPDDVDVPETEDTGLEAASEIDPDDRAVELEEEELAGDPRKDSFGFGDPAD